MKRGKKMILLICVLALMLGGYFLVQQMNRKSSVTETAGTFDLTIRTADDLMGLSWTADHETWMFTLKDGVWETLDTPTWPVDQTKLQNMADRLIALQGTRKIEDVENLADYGLDEPAITVTASWTNGTSTAYSMGDATPFSDGYYLSLSGQQGTIYTISSSLKTIFSGTKTELAGLEAIPEIADANELTVGTTFHAVKKAESTTIDPNQFWYDAETDMPLDQDVMETLIDKAKSVEWDELISTNASSEELTSWELDEANARKVTLTESSGATAAVLFGAVNENNHYYARLPGSSMVYTVDGENVSGLLTVNQDDLRVSSLIALPYDHLSSAEFTTDKGTWVLKPGVKSTTEETESETDPDQEDAWKALWDQIISLQTSGQPETPSQSGQVLRIHVISMEGKETDIVFSEFSADDYQAIADNSQPVLVPAENIDTIIRTVRTMQKEN